MKPLIALLLIVGAAHVLSQTVLSPPEVADAIAFGQRWKSAQKFLDDGLALNRHQVSSAMAFDGTSKYITILTDWTAIAALSADAHRRLRELTPEEIAGLPNTGLLHAVVELHARGMVPVHRMQGRFGNGVAHLVLKFGDTIVQPLDEQVASDQRSPAYQSWVFTTTVFGRLGWVFAQPVGGWPEEKIVLHFAFAPTDAQRRGRGSAILIDGNGDQDVTTFDFAQLK